ncbi:hypothetical protein [Xanthobacter flavus]|uniref:hypothetical protein n=1 Tax=Xanthobacter flavus TaxID=281 RepID=UPI00372CAFA3
MSKKGGNEAEMARMEELARQRKIRQGTTSINSTFDGQFTPQFYDDRLKAFLNYATPQLDSQHADAQKELTFSLARSGLLNSSSRGDLASELAKKYAIQKQSVADQALSYKNTAKTNVEDARANLISTLNATGDATQATNDAITRASVLSQPQAYSPLTDLFADFTSAIGKQAAAERAFTMGGGPRPTYGTILTAPPISAVVNR